MPRTSDRMKAAPPQLVIDRYNAFRGKLCEADRLVIPEFQKAEFIGEGSIRFVFRIPFNSKPAVLKIGKEFMLEKEAREIKDDLDFLKCLELSTIVVPEVLWVGGDRQQNEPGRDWGIVKTDLTEAGRYILEDVTPSVSIPASLLTLRFHDDAKNIDVAIGLANINFIYSLAIRYQGTVPHSMCFSDMEMFRVKSRDGSG